MLQCLWWSCLDFKINELRSEIISRETLSWEPPGPQLHSVVKLNHLGIT